MLKNEPSASPHHRLTRPPAPPGQPRRCVLTFRRQLALGLVAALIAGFKFGIALLAFLAN